jgi:enoyl-CoA hydratase/carnithine racemase
MSAVMMKYILLDLQSDKDIAIIKINRPEVLNALNKEVISELSTAIDIVGADDKIRGTEESLLVQEKDHFVQEQISGT